MQALLSPLDVELDPETQAVVDEVCEALEWYDPQVPGSTEMVRAFDFRRKWYVALTCSGDHVCRQKIAQAMEALVRSDPDLFVAQGGVIFPRSQIKQCHGRESYVVDSQTGEMRQMIEWPTGTYAGGAPSYERPEGRAA